MMGISRGGGIMGNFDFCSYAIEYFLILCNQNTVISELEIITNIMFLKII